jgi:hypothetical protein
LGMKRLGIDAGFLPTKDGCRRQSGPGTAQAGRRQEGPEAR